MPETSARRRTRPMTLVCHFLAERAVEGRIVGHVEIVDTGEMVAIASVDDLIALVERLGSVELAE